MPRRAKTSSDSEYIQAVRDLEAGIGEGIPDWEYRRKQERRAWKRERTLRTYAGRTDVDKWGNTPHRRRMFLENKIEQSERKIRIKRMLNGAKLYGAPWSEKLADVRSAEFRSAASEVAKRICRPLPATYMRWSQDGEDENGS